MTASLNKVILMGNLGKEPLTRTLESGVVMCTFPIATSEIYKNRNSGEKTSHTEWHNVVLWRNLAELAEKYLHKGDKILIEGRIRSRSWKDQESGHIRFTTEVLANQMQMIRIAKRNLSSETENKFIENQSSFIKESPFENEQNMPF